MVAFRVLGFELLCGFGLDWIVEIAGRVASLFVYLFYVVIWVVAF